MNVSIRTTPIIRPIDVTFAPRIAAPDADDDSGMCVFCDSEVLRFVFEEAVERCLISSLGLRSYLAVVRFCVCGFLTVSTGHLP